MVNPTTHNTTMEIANLRLAHRLSGAVLAIFLLAHMGYVLAALAGHPAQRELLEALRAVYRFPPAEALLLACVLVQMASGMRMVLHGWRRCRGLAQRARFASGAYLAFFLLVHVGAVMAARGLFGIDTDIDFAMAGVYALPDALFFAPYYLLAVASLLLHALLSRAAPSP